jgi:hypothetical protein
VSRAKGSVIWVSCENSADTGCEQSTSGSQCGGAGQSCLSPRTDGTGPPRIRLSSSPFANQMARQQSDGAQCRRSAPGEFSESLLDVIRTGIAWVDSQCLLEMILGAYPVVDLLVGQPQVVVISRILGRRL